MIIRRAPYAGAVADLDARLFPSTAPSRAVQAGAWWGAYDGRELVAYAAAMHWPTDRHIFLSRAGVARAWRGRGLQKRLIRVRIAWAKREGAPGVFTYTLHNPASARNLIACGLRPYEPIEYWAGDDAAYWIRSFA